MLRNNTFQFGRASEELYNNELMLLYNSLKNLHAIVEPEGSDENTLWIDGETLKIKKNGKFIPLYNNYYQSMNTLIQNDYPINPTPGQLWIDKGVLVYYTGIKWEAVKATTIDDFSMDGFEPFLIIDSLEASANQIIKREFNIIEEEFIGAVGLTEFILQRGTYEPGRNNVVVYVNGRILSKTKVLQHNSSVIRLTEPLKKEENVLIQYISKTSILNTEYIPLKFHPELQEFIHKVIEPTHFVKLPPNIFFEKEYMCFYINGRFISNHYYTVEKTTSETSLRSHVQLQSGDEVFIQYYNRLVSTPMQSSVSETSAYSQYLWPSSDYDKLFINGKLYLDYETVNNVTIQYPSSVVQGQQLSAVHVHPKNLSNIEKRIYAFDKNTRHIQCDESHTEFYGLKISNKIEDSQFERTTLYSSSEKKILQDNRQRNFIIHVTPNTSYTLKRAIESNIFKIVECSTIPSANATYNFLVDLTSQLITYNHTFTTKATTHYLLIEFGTDHLYWYTPIMTTSKLSYKSKLLIKTNKSDTDYTSAVGGILLSTHIAEAYDYVLLIKYIFSDKANRGILKKTSFLITDDSQILLDKITDPLLVFAQGYYLIPENNYRYDLNTGLLTLLFPEKVDIGIITFPKYEAGRILEMTDTGKGIIRCNKTMTQPLIFVYGQNIQKLIDFEVSNAIYYIPNAQIGMHYAIVDCVDTNGRNMYVNNGSLLYDANKKLYYAQTNENFNQFIPILFVDGLLVNAKDIFFENNRLYIKNGGSIQSKYVLLKDELGRFLHSEIKSPNTFVTSIAANQALLYIEGSILGDFESFASIHLPSVGYENEIKGKTIYDTQNGYEVTNWYKYSRGQWVEITNTQTIELFKKCFAHYVLEDKAIHFEDAENFINKRCHAWLYQYDTNIEEPLKTGVIETRSNKVFSVYPQHGFNMNQNELNVYINGYRQYPETYYFKKGVKELNTHQFEISEVLEGHTIDYIVEHLERDESKSCEFEILTNDAIKNHILATHIPLLPGFVSLFIDGIRQSAHSIKIINRHSIYLEDYIVDERYNNMILVEYRKDLSIKEATVKIKYDNQEVFLCKGDLRELIYSKDHIKVYFNGLYLAKCYEIDYDQEAIIVSGLKGIAKKGDSIIFEWR